MDFKKFLDDLEKDNVFTSRPSNYYVKSDYQGLVEKISEALDSSKIVNDKNDMVLLPPDKISFIP